MKLRYQARKRQRIKGHGFIWITSWCSHWWHEDEQRWTTSSRGPCSNTCTLPCRSVRAFRRRLREWSSYLPPGSEFVLASRWRGYDVYGRTA